MPDRIQRQRTKGWRKPAGVLYVGRPTRWGNPFYPGSGLSMGGVTRDGYLAFPKPTPANCVTWFEVRLNNIRESRPQDYAALLEPLRGKHLMCWCAVGQPCHADVLLRLANA
jgi:Domain of unknown function (DUF4326)